MTRTGARAAVLAQLLESAGLPVAPRLSSPTLSDLRHEDVDAVLELYRKLGGQHDTPALKPGPWDLAVADGEHILLIELDEDLHFNRYRAITLTAPWYQTLARAGDYLKQCRNHEQQCARAGSWGQRWTTVAAERLFGLAGPPGQLPETARLDGNNVPYTTRSKTPPPPAAERRRWYASPSTTA